MAEGYRSNSRRQISFESDKPQVQTLEGALSASNTADQPHAIKPTTVAWKHRLHAGETTVTFPAHTFTVIRL